MELDTKPSTCFNGLPCLFISGHYPCLNVIDELLESLALGLAAIHNTIHTSVDSGRQQVEYWCLTGCVDKFVGCKFVGDLKESFVG